MALVKWVSAVLSSCYIRSSAQARKHQRSTCLPTRRWMPKAVVALWSGPRRTGALPAGAVKSLQSLRSCRVHSLKLVPSGRSGLKQRQLLGVASVPRRLRRLAPHSVPSLEAGTLTPPGPQSVRHYILPDKTALSVRHNFREYLPSLQPQVCGNPSLHHTGRVCGPQSPQSLTSQPNECAALHLHPCTRESVRHYISATPHHRCARLMPKDFHKTDESLRHPNSVRHSILTGTNSGTATGVRAATPEGSPA